MGDRLRYAAIRALDWIDDRVLNHPSHRLCCWIGEHPWWDAAPRKGKRRP